jgi:hypothetical protein
MYFMIRSEHCKYRFDVPAQTSDRNWRNPSTHLYRL